MQPEAEAFLQRIRAYPDDDAQRLIFADWLDEVGDPRGRFIRVQLALAQVRSGEWHLHQWLAQYAQQSWARCARVQRKAMRNGHWFHATGWKAWIRDWGLRVQGPRIMDVPWLYEASSDAMSP